MVDAYLRLGLHAAAVVAEQLHLTLRERAGGGAFRWHGSDCDVGKRRLVLIVSGKD